MIPVSAIRERFPALRRTHRGRPRTPTISFMVAGMPSAKVAEALAEQGIFLSNGNFYATNVVARLGVGADGLVRAGCACYTTEGEVERLIEAVARLALP